MSTPNLNLAKPLDANTAWGNDIRGNFDILDANPGIVTVADEAAMNALGVWSGRICYRVDVALYFTYIGIAWQSLKAVPATHGNEAHTEEYVTAADVPIYFTNLLDTPVSYIGEAGKAVIVKITEDGLEFGEAPAATMHGNEAHNPTFSRQHLLINEQIGTSYTLVLGDDGKLIDCNNAAPFTLTVPIDASVEFPVGAQILVRQKGAGQVTIAADGVTLRSADGELKLRVQYSIAGLIKLAADTWAVFGDVMV